MVTLTTTLSELNRLYGVYYDTTCDTTCTEDPKVAEQVWKPMWSTFGGTKMSAAYSSPRC